MASVPFLVPPSHAVVRPHGRFEAWTDRPGRMLGVCVGHFDNEMCDAVIAASEVASTGGGARIVHDWREMTTFDVATPPRLINWVVRHRARIERAMVVIRSPLVAMAVRAANVTLKNTLMVTNRGSDLDAELASW